MKKWTNLEMKKRTKRKGEKRFWWQVQSHLSGKCEKRTINSSIEASSLRESWSLMNHLFYEEFDYSLREYFSSYFLPKPLKELSLLADWFPIELTKHLSHLSFIPTLFSIAFFCLLTTHFTFSCISIETICDESIWLFQWVVTQWVTQRILDEEWREKNNI